MTRLGQRLKNITPPVINELIQFFVCFYFHICLVIIYCLFIRNVFTFNYISYKLKQEWAVWILNSYVQNINFKHAELTWDSAVCQVNVLELGD